MVLTPNRARVALASLLAVALIGLKGSGSVAPPPRDPATTGDLKLHQYTIERLASEHSYYAVVGSELRKHRYPSASLFNWRTPLHYELVSTLSIERAAQLMSVLALIAVITGTLAYASHPPPRTITAFIVLFGAMLPPLLARSGVVLFPEAWAGVAMGLSLNAYVARRFASAAVFGVIAVFFRELAAPYALVCGLLALRASRWREFAVWSVGGLAYTAYFGLHALAVSNAIQPGDVAHTQSWIRLLGLPFVYQTLYLYGWLTLAPPALTALAAAVGLAAVAAPSAPPQLRLSLMVYVVFYCVVGQPFNFYWGYVAMALWGHAFVYSGEGVGTLFRSAVPAQARVKAVPQLHPIRVTPAAGEVTTKTPEGV